MYIQLFARARLRKLGYLDETTIERACALVDTIPTISTGMPTCPACGRVVCGICGLCHQIDIWPGDDCSENQKMNDECWAWFQAYLAVYEHMEEAAEEAE